MFRNPNDVTSSDPESSTDESESGLQSRQNARRRRDQMSTEEIENDALSFRTDEEEAISQNEQRDFVNWLPSNPDEHATIMTTALLESHLNVVAAEALNESQGVSHYTRHSQEAQTLGRTMYMQSSQQLASTGWIAPGVEGDAIRDLRARYLNLIDTIGLHTLMSLHGQHSQEPRRGPPNLMPSLPADQALRQARPARQELIRTDTEMRKLVTNLETISLSSSFNLARSSSLSPTSSRYLSDFQEIGFLGKGGYGSVYHAKHKVDNQDYAVKKIPLNPRRFRKWQNGKEELENILKEIRTLARLEHVNIVRYFNAWVEHPAVPLQPPSRVLPEPSKLGKLLQQNLEEDKAGEQNAASNASPLHSNEKDPMPPFKSDALDGLDIVFGEDTKTGAVTSHDSNSNPLPSKPLEKQRQVSLASQGTAHSRMSRKSFFESAGIDDDDEVESIRRSASLTSNAISAGGESLDDLDSIFTDGIGQKKSQLATVPSHAASAPTVSLHIQMSLHPLNLATYLSPPILSSHTTPPTTIPRHCYHLLPSTQLLLCILSGVEYLHSKSIVHRDLKPGNIFMSNPGPYSSSSSTSPAGSVDISRCPQCCSVLSSDSTPATTHLSPRIGDFGLVAEITQEGDVAVIPNTRDRQDRSSSSSSPKSAALVASPTSPSAKGRPVHTQTQPHRPAAPKHVGTEFYRPPPSSSLLSTPPTAGKQNNSAIDAKVDIFALGVIFFELLHPFTTKMERMTVLKALTSCKGKGGQLPPDFSQRFVEQQQACDYKVMERVEECLLGMVYWEPRNRWTCADVRHCLEGIVADLEKREECT